MVLYPFVNRLDGGRYTYRGQSYQFAVNEPARNNSLHGLLMTEHAAALTLLYSYPGDNPGYPFPAEIRLTYHLTRHAGLDPGVHG